MRTTVRAPGDGTLEPAERMRSAGFVLTERSRPLAVRALLTMARCVALGVCGVILLVLAALSLGPRLSHVRTIPVLGGSMEPTIHIGSLLIAHEVRAEALRVGDIITFHPPGQPGLLVTHRIVRIERSKKWGRVFVTGGDANHLQDPWVVPVRGEGLKYSASIPKAGYAFVRISSPSSRLALLSIVIILMSVMILVPVWRSPSPRATPATLARA